MRVRWLGTLAGIAAATVATAALAVGDPPTHQEEVRQLKALHRQHVIAQLQFTPTPRDEARILGEIHRRAQLAAQAQAVVPTVEQEARVLGELHRQARLAQPAVAQVLTIEDEARILGELHRQRLLDEGPGFERAAR